MSIPPSKSVPGEWVQTNNTFTGPDVTHKSVTKKIVVSSVGVRRKTSFVYRGPTIIVGGELRVEGETYATGQLSDIYDPIKKKTYKKKRANWSLSGNVLGEDGVWRKPRKKGQKIVYPRGMWRDPLPYSCKLVEGDISHFSANIQLPNHESLKWSWIRYQGDLPVGNWSGMGTPAFPAYSAALKNSALIKALNGIKSQDVNLGIAFGERKETTKMLEGTLRKLTKAAKAVRKGDLKKAVNALTSSSGTRKRELNRLLKRRTLSSGKKKPRGQALTDNWLELQYGWKPLYNDVYGSVAALNKRDLDDPKRYTISYRATCRDTSTSRKTFNTGAGWGYGNVLHREELAVVRLDYYLENPLLRTLAQLGITNPAEVAWNLVPGSFIWDWFQPIGSYLSCMDADLGLQFRAGSLTRSIRQKFNAWVFPEFTGLAAKWPAPRFANGQAVTNGIIMDRTIYTSSPLPRIPGSKNAFPKDGKHIANGIALFASNLRP